MDAGGNGVNTRVAANRKIGSAAVLSGQLARTGDMESRLRRGARGDEPISIDPAAGPSHPVTVHPASYAAVCSGEADSSPALLQHLFERQARARPGATALVCFDESMTYEQLEQRANQLARLLRQQGIGRGDCVGLLLPRSLDPYAALLAVLKAGAAYVPLDPGYPAERVAFILADCQARALITSTELAPKAMDFKGHTICLDQQRRELASFPATPLLPQDPTPAPEDLCYIIYTSGTTGRPKGVQIEHRSAVHLVQTEGDIFQVRPEDRVYQGFSLAFDASVEEIWLAFFAGASLVAGTAEMVRAGPALSGILAKAGVTVFSCVPTLLAMMETDVPSMRLLILGGEACPPGLVKRWLRPGRRVVNTYGPTEATVIATYTECRPDQPVTIGAPVPGYCACILDEHLQPVPEGAAGELCLGGIGLARGYVGRPELTAEKFVQVAGRVVLEAGIWGSSPVGNDEANRIPANSGADSQLAPVRLYRTGDRVRWNPNRELEFFGRLDAQVKIRGFRVELSEIESVLAACHGVKAAAVTLREDTPGIQKLVGYIVPRRATPPAAEDLRRVLRARLPAYMVPALLETISELPTLPSGKVDRKSLPAPRGQSPKEIQEVLPPRTLLERQITAVWEKLLAPLPVSVAADFFLELGGHSLLAAQMVSELRRQPAFVQLSVLDVYRHPTIERLAAHFESQNGHRDGPGLQPGTTHYPPHAAWSRLLPSNPDEQKQRPARTPALIPFWRHFFCGAAQLVSLVFVLSFFALQWLAPYLTYTVLVEEEYDFIEAILGAFASLIVIYPVMLVIPILVKWLVIGRYKPGAYPLWGSYYFRWWLVTTIEAAVPVGYLAGTPLLGIYLRLMGARVGPNVHLDSDSFAIYDLLTIGEGSSINVDSNLLGYTVEDGCLKLGRITIGRRCFVGTRSALREDTVMEDDSTLEDLSLLSRGQTLPRGQTWRGSPAQKVEAGDAAARRDGRGLHEGPKKSDSMSAPPTRLRRFVFGFLHGVGLLVFPVLVVAALFPGIVVMNHLNYLDPYYWYLLLSPLVGLSFIALLCLEIAAVKWLLLGKVKPGSHPLHSFYYLRKWFVDQTMDLSLDILGPLYASVYLTPWYKLLGARLGKGAEISTASFISPDLLSIGEESFIADSVSLGAPRVRDGCMTIGKNHIGRRSFIGNSAMLPPDTVIGDSVLIGCLSAPPTPAEALREDSAWFGSPPIFLPQRQKSGAFGEETTFNPSARLRVLRATIEFVRVIAPSTGFIMLLSLMFSALLLLNDEYSLVQTLLFFPALYLGCGLAATLFTISPSRSWSARSPARLSSVGTSVCSAHGLAAASIWRLPTSVSSTSPALATKPPSTPIAQFKPTCSRIG
jgi:non-ribosomal peptide synthetase-like protein